MECTNAAAAAAATTATNDNMIMTTTSPMAVIINSKPFNSSSYSHDPSPTNSSSSNSVISQSPPSSGHNISVAPAHDHQHPSTPPPGQAHVIMSPCAACKILRRRCVEKCVLAPYFPPTEPLKFTIAHRVFGASNIIKLLQELPETQRADAVSSMVYEATTRIRDPIYGCAGAIFQLQRQVSELQAELAKAQADVFNLQSQKSSLLSTLICMEMTQAAQQLEPMSPQPTHYNEHLNFFPEDGNLTGIFHEPLWI